MWLAPAKVKLREFIRRLFISFRKFFPSEPPANVVHSGKPADTGIGNPKFRIASRLSEMMVLRSSQEFRKSFPDQEMNPLIGKMTVPSQQHFSCGFPPEEKSFVSVIQQQVALFRARAELITAAGKRQWVHPFSQKPPEFCKSTESNENTAN